MTSPATNPARRPSTGLIVIVAASVIVVGASFIFDGPVFRALHLPGAEREDWHRLFRVMGYLPTWIFAAVAAGLLSGLPDPTKPPPHPGNIARGLYVFLSAALGGLVAELMKLVVRRERPDIDLMEYIFRPFADRPWSTSGLGMPSSHTMVAFAGAAALCFIAPRASAVWLALAAGCAFTRVADRAHWLSDAAVGAAGGVFVAWALWRVAIGRAPRGGAELGGGA